MHYGRKNSLYSYITYMLFQIYNTLIFLIIRTKRFIHSYLLADKLRLKGQQNARVVFAHLRATSNFLLTQQPSDNCQSVCFWLVDTRGCAIHSLLFGHRSLSLAPSLYLYSDAHKFV